MKRRIALIGPAFPLRGGIADFTERLATAYRDKGEEVSIESFKLQYPSFLFPGKTQYREGQAPSNLNIRSSINSINPLNWLRVGRRIKQQAPELVIFKFWIPFLAPCLGTIARVIGRNKKSRMLCVVDNIIPHEKRPMDRLLARYFIKSMHGFVAMSSTVQNQIKELNPRIPSLLSPHPVYDHFGEKCSRNKAIESLSLDPSKQYMLFFGLVRDYKGLDLLLQAMASPKLALNKDLHLIVAGEFYSDKNKTLDFIKQHGLEERIIIKDQFIKNEEVGLYFSAADIVVQPYKTATQSGVTQIAYHFEKPMIVTNVGGLPEIVPHHKVGYVCDVDPLSIADAVHDFYTSNSLDVFDENIKEEKKKYSWEYMLNSIEKLLHLSN